MDRIHAFEFNERPETPAFIRDSITEILGGVWRILRFGNPLGPVFSEFCQRAGARRILDLASGSGEPAALLMDGLIRQGDTSTHLTLSDLFPKVPAMERVAVRHPGRIDVARVPVDAADVPEGIDCDGCTIVGAFHHFPPDLATRILADCVSKGRSIFILDVPGSAFWAFLLLFPIPGFFSLLAHPLLTREDRLLKALFTYLVPLIPALGSWDYLVSALRFYSEAEYRNMADRTGGDYAWEYCEVSFLPGARLAVFWGIPREKKPSPSTPDERE